MRVKERTADLILTSDWHLRETTPICRTDDFWETQWKKVEFVGKLATQHGCPVLHAGDLFHHWKPSPNLIRMCIKHLPTQFYTIYGQHDLPQHNWELREKSGIAAVEEARRLIVLDNCHWGQEPNRDKFSMITNHRGILVWHKMIWQGKKLWPDQVDPSAMVILKKYETYDLIVTGDNHKAFVEEYNGRLLVNPGSLTRQDADQIDFKPRIYLYYADENRVEPVMVPIQKDAVTGIHIERSEERSDRIRAFVDKIATGEWEAGMSFEKNMEIFLSANNILNSTRQIIHTAMDYEKGK